LADNQDDQASVVRRVRRDLLGHPVLWLSLITLASVASGVIWFRPKGLAPNDILYQICFTIGVGCLAALISAVIDRQYTVSEFDRVVRKNIRTASSFQESLANLGLRRIHHAPFRFETIFAAASPGDEILWLDTYCPRKDEFFAAMSDSIQRGVTIRMLIIDPNCANAKHRSDELENTADTGPAWQSGLVDFRLRMEQLAARVSSKLQIRHYDDLLGMPMYLIVAGGSAKRGFFSLFLSHPTAHFVHFELEGGSLITSLHEYFEAKWKRHANNAVTASPPGPSPAPATATAVPAPSIAPPAKP
jgi:hypothetical protein